MKKRTRRKIMALLMILLCIFSIGFSINALAVGKKKLSSTETKKTSINKTKVTTKPKDTITLRIINPKGKVKWSTNTKKYGEIVDRYGKFNSKCDIYINAITDEGSFYVKAKTQGKTYKCKITVKKNKKKTNSSTEDTLSNNVVDKYGDLAGNVSYYYNSYKGYVADTNAKVLVFDQNDNLVGTTSVDGVGNYKIQHLPVGNYHIMMCSVGSKSTDELKAQTWKLYQEKYNVSISVSGRIYHQYNVIIYENKETYLSHNFPMSDY